MFPVIILLAAFVGGSEVEPVPQWLFPNSHSQVASAKDATYHTLNRTDHPIVELLEGSFAEAPDAPWPEKRAYRGTDRLVFQINSLEPGAQYVLGLAWYAPEATQSVYLGAQGAAPSCALPATPARAFYEDKPTWSAFVLPLPDAVVRSSSARVEIRAENGKGASLGQLVLLRKEDAQARKRVLIVTGDDYPGHRWRETAPELAAMLREDPRLEVSITESPAFLGSPLLSHYDAVLLHFKNYTERLPLGSEVWSGLEGYVQQGGGLVVAHFGCGAFQEWNGYVNVAGRVWNPAFRAHDPYGPFQVRVTEPNHPITQGLAAFETRDELYTCLDGAPAIQVLCEATSVVDQKPYPMGFVLRPGQGRVFHSTLGHDVAALKSPGTRDLYRRAALWAAGLSSESKQ